MPHPDADLTRARLLDAATDEGLDRLGVHAPDRAAVAGWLHAVADDPADLAVTAQLRAAVLLPAIGAWDAHVDGPRFDAALDRHRLGVGVLPLCALAATADDVLAHQARRGLAADLGVRTLNDLGQQVMKHRHVYGEPGLHNQGWLRTVWSGDFLWLGRLQFEPRLSDLGVAGGPARRVLSVHIPQTGPLTPASVDAAFAAASATYSEHLPHLAPEAFICDSWLLDPLLTDLVPGSNLARFAERWTPWECGPGDWAAAYFVFDVNPPGRSAADPETLPTDSTLRRRLVEHWRAGGHVQVCQGVAHIRP